MKESEHLVKIRLATEDDILRILEIEQEANSPPWTHGSFLSELYKDDSCFVVAVDSFDTSTIVGFAILSQVGDDGELLKIAVEGTSRGCGVGDLLMISVLEYSVENTFKSIFLEVRKSNTPAINLYKKHGFKNVRTRKDYYDSPVEDAVIMAKPV